MRTAARLPNPCSFVSLCGDHPFCIVSSSLMASSMTHSFDRRDVLKLASGLALSFAVPGLDARGAGRRGAEREKSLIIIWLDGGPSQLETWDPHPGTPVGGPTKSIATSIPGVEIASA